LIVRPHSTTLVNMSEILVDNRNELKRTREFTRLRVKQFRDHQRREVALPNLTLH